MRRLWNLCYSKCGKTQPSICLRLMTIPDDCSEAQYSICEDVMHPQLGALPARSGFADQAMEIWSPCLCGGAGHEHGL